MNGSQPKPIEATYAEIVPAKTEPLSVAEMRTQVDHIQQMMKAVMKNKEHYGTIPGCGNKPALLKPGAEKLGMVFRLRPEYDIEEKELDGGHREYRIKTNLYHMSTGEPAGQGVGVCLTSEPKYNSRPPSAVMNTVLKMAKKRSHVDAILTATAASDIFTQDIEDGGNGDTTSKELSILAYDLCRLFLKHVQDEGGLSDFSHPAIQNRLKLLTKDTQDYISELAIEKEREFQHADGEGKAD